MGTKNGGLTRFGAALLKIMADRGMREVTQLCAVLEEHGHVYKRQRVSNWLYGRYPVDNQFPHAVEESLDLTEEESDAFAHAFTFGQRRKVVSDKRAG